MAGQIEGVPNPTPAQRRVTPEDVRNIFAYHAPADPRIRMAHEQVREVFGQFAEWCNENLPECPEKEILIRGQLRESMMWTNAIIATKGVDAAYEPNLGIYINVR